MLRVLGPLELEGPDGPMPLGGPVPRRILCALLVRPGAVVPVATLLDAAWGDDPPASAERTLISHITRLREALGRVGGTAAPRLERRDGGYRLVLAPDAVDSLRFEQALLDAKKLPPAQAAAALREALAAWRGPAPFADLQDTAYPAAEAARLTELRGSAGEALVAAILDARDAVTAVAEAEARLHDDPYRERLWELLMLALYRQGRQGDALAAYQRAREELSEELGVDPGPGLRELESRLLAQDPGLLVTSTQARQPCPYKGLARYDTADADLFVGRERLVEELVARLVDERLLVVVGPSGAGKSSLVRAGLVAALAGGALPGSDAWRVTVVLPGTDPLGVVNAALRDRPSLVVIDQAEEALLADDGAWLSPFGDRVLAAVGDETRVVLVLRADFFGLLAGHPVLARRAGPATVLVGPPDEQELRRIVTEPAALVGLRVEPSLADLVVAEVRERPGALPVLSTALVRTWEHRDGDTLSVAAYRAGGGVEAALQRVGEEAWAAFDDDAEQAACRRLLLRLAMNENGSWVRRWARRADVVRPDDPAAAAALAVLTARRLVVARADDLGIAHEALLTGWPRLHGWLEDGRTRADVRERLGVTAAAWDQADHDPAELYRGTRLQAALDLAAATPEDLTPLERDFLTQSAAEAERQLAEQRARADREARGRRRARLVAGVLAVTLTFAASAGGYAVFQQRQAVRAAATADAGRLGALARAGGAYDRAVLLAAQAVKLDPSPATESDLFATLLRGDAVVGTMRTASRTQAIAFNADSQSIVGVAASGDVIRWPAEGGPGVLLAHLAQPPGLPAFNGVADVGAQIEVAAEGRIVVGVTEGLTDSRLQLLDADGSRVLQQVPADLSIGWALAPDRKVVVAAAGSIESPSTYVLIWRLGAAEPVRLVPVRDKPIRIAMCGADIACVLTDRELVRIRLADATVERRLPLPRNMVDSEHQELAERLVGNPDGQTLAIVGLDGRLRVLDARTGRLVREFTGITRDLHALAFSPDGSRIVAADYETVLIWHTDGRGLPERHDVHGGRVLSASWSADGNTLATIGRDGGVVTLDTTGRRRVGALLTDALHARTTTFWPTESAFVVGQVDGHVLFVDPTSGRIAPAEVQPHGPNAVDTARAGRSGSLLVTADYRGGTAVWDLPSHEFLGSVPLPEASGAWADTWVSPDGRLAATLRNADGPIIFDPLTRQVVRQLPPLPPPETAELVGVQGWTADGRSILITRQLTSTTSDLLVVDATSGEVTLQVPTGAAVPAEAAADPTGRYIAVGTSTGTLLIMDAEDGHTLAPPLHANDGPVKNVSISPDGRYIATAGQPPRLTLWDTRTFRQVGVPLPLDVNAVDARARFAPDGRLVVTSGAVLRAFTIEPAQWLARACRVAGRTLTQEEFEEVLPGRPYEPACA
jgi:DNA-binding SARP family transcriptional activator/WD40 repeat protein